MSIFKIEVREVVLKFGHTGLHAVVDVLKRTLDAGIDSHTFELLSDLIRHELLNLLRCRLLLQQVPKHYKYSVRVKLTVVEVLIIEEHSNDLAEVYASVIIDLKDIRICACLFKDLVDLCALSD